jgi:hypothetical protein
MDGSGLEPAAIPEGIVGTEQVESQGARDRRNQASAAIPISPSK